MASCTQIVNRLQAYIDGDLGASERAILEQHLTECRSCKTYLGDTQRSSAFLFEVYADARLDHDLTGYVMDHLPEMDEPAVDVASLNFRAKHPSLMRERAVRLVPIAAAVLLVFLAAVLNENWPAALMAPNTIGIVAYNQGDAYRIEKGSTDRGEAKVGTFTLPGDRYETGDNSFLMVKLLGPTELRAAANTRFLIHNDRKVSVEKGRVFLDVDGNKRLFRVLTPTGEITVFGTRFDVHVDALRTTVTVIEGEVQLGSVADESVFSIVRPGQLASVSADQTSIHPRPADMAHAAEWMNYIIADEEAEAIFVSRIVPLQTPSEVAGRPGYYVSIPNKPLKGIILEWEPTSPFATYASYDLYVYDDRGNNLFKSRIDGSVFSDPRVTSYEITNSGNQRENLKHAFVRLVPEDAAGKREVTITTLTARIGT